MVLIGKDVVGADDDAMQPAHCFPFGATLIQQPGFFQRFGVVDAQIGIQVALPLDSRPIMLYGGHTAGRAVLEGDMIGGYSGEGYSHLASSCACFFSTFTQSRMLIS